MNKQELASKIWSGANDLRGKISANAYKDYMLGLIFYKYLSEKEERYLAEKLYFEPEDFKSLTERDEETVSSCRLNIGYFIEYDNLFSTWIKNGKDFTIADARKALSAFDRNIGPNYKRVYEKIFDSLQTGLNDFGTGDAERSKGIRGLLGLICQIPVDGSQDYDVLGFVYEYLLKNFAANAGKAGEFYTPYEASTVMSEIISNHLKDRDEISIYDPTSGSGSLLINIGKEISKHIDNPNKVKYYAQELIAETYNLTRMNLIMHDVLPDNIIVRNGDTLADDWPYFDDTDKERTYAPLFVDGCCSNPPYSQSWTTDNADNDIRFCDYGVAPKTKADYAFLLHNLYHLKPDGIMTIVMPHGVLFRGGDEEKIRKNLIEKDNIDTIIGLPANMFFGTGIPTIIIVLKKQRNDSDVLFIDASKGFVKDGNKNRLRARDVRKIVDTVISRESIEGYSRVVSKKEIAEENDYNLNIPRYVDSSDSAEKWDIYATMYGGIPNSEIDELDSYWKAFPTLRSQLFATEGIPYSSLKDKNVKSIVNSNDDVKDYLLNCENCFADMPSYLRGLLIEDYKDVAVGKEEMRIAATIKECVTRLPLIDYYDAYQVLAEKWVSIALDIEVLQENGFETVRGIDELKVLKKDKSSNELYEKSEGFVGRILPFDLIQSVYFTDSKAELDQLEQDLSSLNNEKNALLESIAPDDKAEILNDEGEIDTKKIKAVIARLKKEQKKGAEFEEESFEDIMLRIDAANNQISKLKKSIKEAKAAIESETISKIESLTDDEAKALLAKKWIDPMVANLIKLGTDTVNNLIKRIEFLNNKYETTMIDISSKIDESEKSLSTQLKELVGDEFDMQGIDELRGLLGGGDHG